MELSIVVPVFDEERTLRETVSRVMETDFRCDFEVIIVNDGSTDSSGQIASALAECYPEIRVFSSPKNRGKGSAVRIGIAEARGRMIVIQDADLEYNPAQIPRLIEAMREGGSDAVYGSRFMGRIRGHRILSHDIGNKLLSFIFTLLYGCRITDLETGYKLVKSSMMQSLNLKSDSFDIEVEITAKLAKRRAKIVEIPIEFNARSYQEGKKIQVSDGLQALFRIIYYRFVG